MNVQDVIEQAMSAAQGRAVSQTRAPVGVQDVDVMKLAAALNFIGANLEDSVPSPSELLAQAELMKEAVRKAKPARGMMARQISDNLAASGRTAPAAPTVPMAQPMAAAPSPAAAGATVARAQGRPRLTPEQIEALRNTPEAMARRSERLGYRAADLRSGDTFAINERHRGAIRKGVLEDMRALSPEQRAEILANPFATRQQRAAARYLNRAPAAVAPAPVAPPSTLSAARLRLEEMRAKRNVEQARIDAERAERARLFGAPDNTIPQQPQQPQPQQQQPRQQPQQSQQSQQPRQQPQKPGPTGGTIGTRPNNPPKPGPTGGFMGHIGRNKGRYIAGAAGLAALGTGAYMYAKRNREDQAQKSASVEKQALLGLATGALGAAQAREKLIAAGLSPDQEGYGSNALGGLGRQVGYGLGGGAAGVLAAVATRRPELAPLGAAAGGFYGAYRGYRAPIERAEAAIAQKGRKKTASVEKQALLGLATGALGTAQAREKLIAAGLSPDQEDYASNALGGLGRQVGYSLAGAGTGVLGAVLANQPVLIPVGSTAGSLYGLYRGYRAPVERAEAAIAQKGGRKKRASLHKLAEDAINPAQISAGPAPAFSGEVMPAAAAPVFGGAMSPEQLVAMKAQKVRDRINSEMRSYVSQTGDGYNLDGHLSIFNK